MKLNGKIFDMNGVSLEGAAQMSNEEIMAHEVGKLRATIECLVLVVGEIAKATDEDRANMDRVKELLCI